MWNAFRCGKVTEIVCKSSACDRSRRRSIHACASCLLLTSPGTCTPHRIAGELSRARWDPMQAKSPLQCGPKSRSSLEPKTIERQTLSCAHPCMAVALPVVVGPRSHRQFTLEQRNLRHEELPFLPNSSAKTSATTPLGITGAAMTAGHVRLALSIAVTHALKEDTQILL